MYENPAIKRPYPPYYTALCECGWSAEVVEATYPDSVACEHVVVEALGHDPSADTAVEFILEVPPEAKTSLLTQSVLNTLRASLVGRSLDGVRVAQVVEHGAVEVETKLLVVWLLLDGPRPEQIPERLLVSPTLAESQRPSDPDYDWLLDLRSEIEDAFRSAAWPYPDQIKVNVDSRERVASSGGRRYFK